MTRVHLPTCPGALSGCMPLLPVSQAVGEALLPLVAKLKKGKELGKAVKAKVGTPPGWGEACGARQRRPAPAHVCPPSLRAPSPARAALPRFPRS